MRHFRLSPVLAGLLLAGLSPALSGASPSIAQADPSDRPLWLRRPAVSPDGQHIAFVYGGQLWRVPAGGGEALPLTSAEFIADHPVWSPDSRSIAFSANRHGNADVFIMPAKGGEIRRLTTHSQADTPQAFTADGKSVLFTSMRLGDPKVAFGGILSGSSIQLYSIPVTGGRERLIIPTPALDTKPSPDGRFILYTSLNAGENEWRKHAVSEATRDIWVYDTTSENTSPAHDVARRGSRCGVQRRWEIGLLAQRAVRQLQRVEDGLRGRCKAGAAHRAPDASGAFPEPHQPKRPRVWLRRRNLEAGPRREGAAAGRGPHQPGLAARRRLLREDERGGFRDRREPGRLRDRRHRPWRSLRGGRGQRSHPPPHQHAAARAQRELPPGWQGRALCLRTRWPLRRLRDDPRHAGRDLVADAGRFEGNAAHQYDDRCHRACLLAGRPAHRLPRRPHPPRGDGSRDEENRHRHAHRAFPIPTRMATCPSCGRPMAAGWRRRSAPRSPASISRSSTPAARSRR